MNFGHSFDLVNGKKMITLITKHLLPGAFKSSDQAKTSAAAPDQKAQESNLTMLMTSVTLALGMASVIRLSLANDWLFFKELSISFCIILSLLFLSWKSIETEKK